MKRATLLDQTVLLLPANEVCEGYVFTPCLSFCSQGRGCLPQCMLGYTPLSRHLQGADTPSWSRHSTPWKQIPIWEQTPPGADTPSAQCMLGDTGNKRVISILLECILLQTNKNGYNTNIGTRGFIM